MKFKILIKKIIAVLFTLLMVTMLTFVGFELIKSDAAVNILGTEADEGQLQALREKLGLNQPLPLRYMKYIERLLQGDFGESLIYKEPVADMLKDKLIITVSMTIMGMFFVVLISFTVSMLAVLLHGKFLEHIIIVINQIVMSIPSFFMGMIIILVFGFGFKLFLPGGFVSYKENPAGFFAYMIFPALTIALPKCAMATKLLINSIHDEYRNPYVKTAISRGNSKFQVLSKHILKNAFLPIVTFLGMAITSMLASGIVVEQVFGIPGLSRLLVTGISNRDYPVVQAIILFIATGVVIINLIVDLIYHFIDPRIRVE